MSLQSIILNKLQDKDKAQIAKKLGYSTVSKLESSIRLITENKYLGLDKNTFSFNLTNRQLLRKLCDELEIPELLYTQIIKEIDVELSKDKGKKPYFFLETNFKRDSQPIFALAGLQGRRFLAVNKDIYKLPLNSQLEKLSAVIQAHHKSTPKLDMWGTIEFYVYYYDTETVVVFSTEGKVVRACTEYFYSRATMSLK